MEIFTSFDDPEEVEPRFCKLTTTHEQQMEKIVRHHVKKITQEDQTSLIELLYGYRTSAKAKTPRIPLVAPATDFLSYTWQEPLSGTVSSLESHLDDPQTQENRYIWWDIFCQNQHNAGDVKNTFSTAIEQVNNVLLSLPSVTSPLALTRIWCLFEVASALRVSKLKLISGHNVGDEAQALADAAKFLVPVAEAKATRPEDIDLIMGMISTWFANGHKELDDLLQKNFVKFCGDIAIQDPGKVSLAKELIGRGHKLTKITLENSIRNKRYYFLRDILKEKLLPDPEVWSECLLVLFEVNYDVRRLLEVFVKEADAHLQARDAHQNTVLHLYIPYLDVSGHDRELNTVKFMLEHGVDINATNDNGDTPLHLALKKQESVLFHPTFGQATYSMMLVQELLKLGANPLIKNKDGVALLDWLKEHQETVADFQMRSMKLDIDLARIRAGEMDVDERDPKDSSTPLHRACRSARGKNPKHVDQLLELGANPLIRNPGPNTDGPSTIRPTMSFKAPFDFWFKGSDVARSSPITTELHKIALERQRAAIESIRAGDLDVNQKASHSGETPLHVALRYLRHSNDKYLYAKRENGPSIEDQQMLMIKDLLELGANPKLMDTDGKSATAVVLNEKYSYWKQKEVLVPLLQEQEQRFE
eukprot:m.211782 g.211782  ORF g.211782 m.211782 type:complete len:647 (-) comp26147_c0_seq6:104-2044(-)